MNNETITVSVLTEAFIAIVAPIVDAMRRLVNLP